MHYELCIDKSLRLESCHRDAVPYGILCFREFRFAHPRLGSCHYYVVLFGVLRYRGFRSHRWRSLHTTAKFLLPLTRFHVVF